MADFYGQNDVPAPDTKPIVPTPVGQMQPPAAGANDVEIAMPPRPADMSMTAAPGMSDIPNPTQPPAEARPVVETPPPGAVPDIDIQNVEDSGKPPHLVLHEAEFVPDASLEKAEAQLPPAEVQPVSDSAVIEPIHAIEKEMKKSVAEKTGSGDHEERAYAELLREGDIVTATAKGEIKLEAARKLAA